MSLFKKIGEKYKSKPRYRKARIVTFSLLTLSSLGFGIAGLSIAAGTIGIGYIVSILSLATSGLWGIMTGRAVWRSVREGPVDLTAPKKTRAERKAEKAKRKEDLRAAKLTFEGFTGTNDKKLIYARAKQLSNLRGTKKTKKENLDAARAAKKLGKDIGDETAAAKEYIESVSDYKNARDIADVKETAIKKEVKHLKQKLKDVERGIEPGDEGEVKLQIRHTKDMKTAIKSGAASYKFARGLALFNTILSLAVASLVVVSPVTDSLLKTYSAGNAIANESGKEAEYDDAQLKGSYVSLGTGITSIVGSIVSIQVATAGIRKREDDLIAASQFNSTAEEEERRRKRLRKKFGDSEEDEDDSSAPPDPDDHYAE